MQERISRRAARRWVLGVFLVRPYDADIPSWPCRLGESSRRCREGTRSKVSRSFFCSHSDAFLDKQQPESGDCASNQPIQPAATLFSQQSFQWSKDEE